MAVVAVELLQSRKGSSNPLERVARKVEIKRMLQRGVSLVRGEDLNVAPGKTDQVRLEFGSGIPNRGAPLVFRKEGQVEDTLPHFRFAPMDEIGEISHANGINLFARQKDVKNRFHQC